MHGTAGSILRFQLTVTESFDGKSIWSVNCLQYCTKVFAIVECHVGRRLVLPGYKNRAVVFEELLDLRGLPSSGEFNVENMLASESC